jgi:hypothetical protein
MLAPFVTRKTLERYSVSGATAAMATVIFNCNCHIVAMLRDYYVSVELGL